MSHLSLRLRALLFAALGGLLFLAGSLLLLSQTLPVAAAPEQQKPDNNACLGCHKTEGQTYKLASGEIISLSVDEKKYNEAKHATLACQVCHPSLSGYPHPKNAAKDLRDYELQYKDGCKQCHANVSKDQTDSAHARLLASGNRNAPTCADCHNPHYQAAIKKDAQGKPAASEHAIIAQTCARCHNDIYKQYATSVHGSGVVDNKNPDVPACTDCHGIHKITDPTTAQFRLGSPQMCSNCHTNPAIMGKYGLSTDVLTTYVADFHGTTVSIFGKTHPEEQTNKPVCYDCHGVHDILRVDDPQKGLHVKKNLLVSCQKCHPDANVNFPDSWLSHYIPSPTKAPLVYYVTLFYNILIPVVLGAMALFVISDLVRRQIDKRRPVAVKE